MDDRRARSSAAPKCQKLTTQVKGRRHRLGLEFTIACKWRVFGDHPLKVAAREKGTCEDLWQLAHSFPPHLTGSRHPSR